MSEVHEPAAGIRRMLSGTPSVLALAALDHALGRFDGVDLAALRAHSLALTDRCIAARRRARPRGGRRRASTSERGSQVSLRHKHAWEVVQALIEAGVVGDFRPPDLIRLGFAPLYVTLEDVDEAMARLADVLRSESWRAMARRRAPHRHLTKRRRPRAAAWPPPRLGGGAGGGSAPSR